jgi:2-polyprenyl-6-methoxyphenol hydroxylase-like FAD-dependent oxidoreductase
MQTSPRHALIIGGGIAGPVAAMFLRRAGLHATIYEARGATTEDTGAFLNLSPNGVNVLKVLGVAEAVAERGFACDGLVFWNGRGQRIGALDSTLEEQRYGARSVLLKRAHLHAVLRDEAERRGIPIEYDKKLTDLTETAEGRVVARFADGTTAQGDLLIGCDGLHSRTRQVILPDAPAPVYTGIVDCGGFTDPSPALPPSGAMQMVFGRRAFFGYFAAPSGEVYWFNNTARPAEPARGKLAAIPAAEWRRQLRDLHAGDPAPVPAIVQSVTGEIGAWPIYDIPFLPAWYRGAVVLVGDAAHATSPHAGQGASMALEDAMVLAKCLRDLPDLATAFAAYQGLRKERVEKLTRQARRTGQQKAVANPIAGWLRDRLLPFFLKSSADSIGWVYAYRIAWETPVAQATRAVVTAAR